MQVNMSRADLLRIAGALLFIVGMLLRAFNHGRGDAGKVEVYPELALALVALGALTWLSGWLATRQAKSRAERNLR